MAKLKVVNNGKTLSDGKIILQGSKNSMLNNLCLPLFTKEPCVIRNVPDIRDINDNLSFLSSLGGIVKRYNKNTVEISCGNIKKTTYDPSLSIRTTGSKFFIPIIVNRFKSYRTGISQGCSIGDRGFENYANSLGAFGIVYKKLLDNTYEFSLSLENQTNITLPFPSFGLTVNAILAAVASGDSYSISNVCQEAEINNTIEMLCAMGASIDARKDNIFVNTNHDIGGCDFRNMSDRNAAVTYSVAALLSGIELVIDNYDDIKMEAFYDFLKSIGAKYSLDENKLIIHKSKLKLTDNEKPKLKAFLYPEFHSDWQPLVSPLLSVSSFDSYVEEWLFQNRLSHWKELEKLGSIYTYDFNNPTRFKGDDFPHAVDIKGGAELSGTDVHANDLRSAACLVLASLVCKGETIISNIDQLDRGYENLVGDLKRLGATMEYI